MLGIQNYLVYKNGRKLPKVHQRDFGYFYSQLKALEKKHGEKLLLGPNDFDIHPALTHGPTSSIFKAIREGDASKKIPVQVLSDGRDDREHLGEIGRRGVVSAICINITSPIHIKGPVD